MLTHPLTSFHLSGNSALIGVYSLDRLRALHKDDVLAPLAAGKMTDEIGATLRAEAASIISGMQ